MTHLKPGRATVTLYQGDDMPRLAELKRAADLAAEGGRMDDGADEAEAYTAFLAEVAERALDVDVEVIGRRRWRDLVLAHPPRMVESEPDDEGRTRQETHPEDIYFDVNTETFPRDLLMFADGKKQTIVSPEFADDEERAEFVDDELSEGQFEKLWITAFELNTGEPQDPKELAQRSSESTT